MTETSDHTTHALIFGAALHDPAFWRDHLMVVKSEAHFDGEYGWVGLSTRERAAISPVPPVRATLVQPEATRDSPDLYFFGEGECPVALFEHAPGVRELRISIEGPTRDDERACWSAGLWLANNVR